MRARTSLLIFINFLIFGLILSFGCSSEEKSQEAVESTESDMSSEAVHGGMVLYDAPTDWVQEQPDSRMRLDQYKLPGVAGADSATLAVFFFPGTGGSVDANLNRWYGQFKQPDGSPTTQHVKKKELQVGELPDTVVYVTGTFLQAKSPMMMQGPVEEKPDYAMLAAIAETEKGPWFFKATGPEKTIDHWRKSFNEFVKTFHVQPS